MIGARTTVYVRLRIDLDDPPALVELRLRIDLDDSPAIIGRRTSHGIAIHSWTAPSDAPAELLDADGTALALPLWRLYTVTGADLGITRATITGFTLHVEGGRVGFSDVGTRDSSLRLLPLWNSALAQPVRFKGGDWTLVTESAALSAPFEPSFALTFPDGDLAVRLAELPKTAPEAGVPAQGYQEIGLQRLLDTLERQLRRADDFVDFQFLKTQANTHRIRQVLLGDDVADDLLVSPILSSVVKKSSALVAEQDLAAVLKAAKTEVTVHSVVVPSHVEVETRMEVLPHINFGAFPILKKQNFPLPSAGVAPGPKVSTAADDVLHAQPAVGQVFDLHTLTIAKRFDPGPVRTSFDFTDSALRETIGRLGDFDLEYDASEALPDTTTGPNNSPVPLRDLANGSIKITDLRFEQTAADDASALFARGIRRADATVFVLRRLEFYIARRRALIARGREVLAEARRRITGAGARLQVDDGALAEARQDVAVARALRREEQDRVAGINRRRDDIIRDEVRFLAYVRPRAVDPRVRRTAGWKLDAPEAALAVPACLRRHDEPPDALHAYIQLFNHAPAAWFVEVGPRLKELDTREKLSELLLAAQRSALTFASDQRIAFAQNVIAPAARNTLLSAYSLVEPARVKTAAIQISQSALLAWNELHRLAELHSVLGDIIGGHHGLPILATVGAGLLRQIEQVATCLHAEFAAVPGAIRLVWAERYSEFDKPAPLNDLTVLPGYGQLDREARRRFQAFVDWLFQRVTPGNAAAFGLINNLVRVCLLLASDAPVNKLIAGRLPRPVPVRPGVFIPILPFDPKQVKVGMEFHVWQAETVVARGRVSDLIGSEVSAKVEHVLTAATVTTLDETMRVQFIPAALGILT